jgi:hypothetical protein
MFVSMRLGLVRTAIKGKIEAIPIISNKAIIMIIMSNKTPRLRSWGESKKNNLLKIFI